MHDRAFLRQHPDLVREGFAKKHASGPLDEFLALDKQFREVKSSSDNLKAEQNRVSKEIGMLMGQGKKEEAEAVKARVGELKSEVQALEAKERELEAQLRQIELSIPNVPNERAPVGDSDEDNVVVREWGTERDFGFEPKAHWDLGESLKLFDLPRGAKIAGSGFIVYTGQGARLQRGLISYFLEVQTSRGYDEVYPPVIVNSDSLIGTAQLPKFEEDLYKIDENLYLIPTAEVPVTNLYRDEILDADQLPIRHCAFSSCFRKEAGSAGKDTRGIQRVHQFDKVELVKICKPEESYEELEKMVTDAEAILQALGLRYRVVKVCTAEMSFSNAFQYDLEVWAPGVGRWLEVSSCSNFEAFQSRRANIRYRPAPGEKPEFVHVLNGSGLATPRIFAAILEQYQNEDGSVTLPEPLRKYVGQDSLK